MHPVGEVAYELQGDELLASVVAVHSVLEQIGLCMHV